MIFLLICRGINCDRCYQGRQWEWFWKYLLKMVGGILGENKNLCLLWSTVRMWLCSKECEIISAKFCISKLNNWFFGAHERGLRCTSNSYFYHRVIYSSLDCSLADITWSSKLSFCCGWSIVSMYMTPLKISGKRLENVYDLFLN